MSLAWADSFTCLPLHSLQEPHLLEPLLLEIEGMKCGGCVRAVEQRLLDQPGVRQASVNLLTRTAWVDLASAEADQGNLLEALAELGFRARLRSSEV